MTSSGGELAHLSIKCRCSCTITYQCTSPSPPHGGWSTHNSQSSSYSSGLTSSLPTGGDQVVVNEIPVLCYSCGHRVTTLYRNITPVAPITGEPYHVTTDPHLQQQTNMLRAAQATSIVLPPQTPVPGLARNGAVAGGPSSLPKLGPPRSTGSPEGLGPLDPVEEDSNFEEDPAQSPSARQGTIIPMY